MPLGDGGVALVCAFVALGAVALGAAGAKAVAVPGGDAIGRALQPSCVRLRAGGAKRRGGPGGLCSRTVTQRPPGRAGPSRRGTTLLLSPRGKRSTGEPSGRITRCSVLIIRDHVFQLREGLRWDALRFGGAEGHV